jgi:hypothetical protein
MNVLGHHYFAQKHPETSQIKFKGKMAPTIAPKISPTLRTGVGSTVGAKDGSPAPDSGPVVAKCQKTAGGSIPQVSSNLDGARRRAKSLRLATAKAAVDKKGPEVIPSDDDDKQGEEATSTMPTKPRKGGRTTPVGKTSSAVRTAPGKAAKLRLGAASNETRAVARAEMPTATHLTRDDNNEDVNVATAIERGLAMVTALGNNCIISGPAPAGKTSPASKKVPGKAAKLHVGAMSDGTRAVARAGMPTGAHLTMDNDDEDIDVATASKRGLARRTALGNDRIIGGQVGANDRPETREVAVAGMPTGVPLTMDDDDEYVVNVTAAGMVRPRSMAVVTAQGPATATGGSAPTGEYLPALLGLAAEENSQGKTGQCGSAANFLPAQKLQHKKEADIAHGVRGGTSGDSMTPGGNKEDNFDDTPEPLPHGMADLQAAMAVEGTTAFRFADVTNAFDIANDWADKYGAFVANLYDEADAIAMALSPAARLQAYLAMLPNAGTFVVLHGLH